MSRAPLGGPPDTPSLPLSPGHFPQAPPSLAPRAGRCSDGQTGRALCQLSPDPSPGKLSLSSLLLLGTVPTPSVCIATARGCLRARPACAACPLTGPPPPPQDDPVTNLNNAFEVAEKYLDIPKMLDAEGKSIPCVQAAPCFVGMICGNQEAGRARQNV